MKKSWMYAQMSKEEKREYQRAYWKSNPEKYIFHACKSRAKRNNVEFNLDVKDIKIPKLCPYLEIEMVVLNEGRQDYSATIDRIDNSKGYVKGNIQIISDLANRMKNSATREQLLTFAKNIQK